MAENGEKIILLNELTFNPFFDKVPNPKPKKL